MHPEGRLMANITKKDLIAGISKDTGISQIDTRAVIEEFLSCIPDMLNVGKNIEIRDFATFYVKKQNPRVARNPKTGQEVLIPERITPKVKFSEKIKEEMKKARNSTLSLKNA